MGPCSPTMDVDDDNLMIDEKEEEVSEKDKDGPVHECLMCLTEFPHSAALGKHYKLVHGKKEGQKMRFQCPKCPKYYISQSQGSLKSHWLSAHLDYYRFQCSKCQKGFHRRDHLKRHVKSSCDKTQQTAVKKDSKSESLSNDAEDNNGEEQSPSLTGQCSQNRPTLKLDDTRTSISSVPCSLTMDIEIVDDDMRINESEKEEEDDENKDGAVLKCLMCLIKFPNVHALGKHYKLIHGKKEGEKMQFQCPKCQKSYAGQDSLKQHWLSVHLDCHRFQCPECQKGFHHRAKLNRHIKSVHKTQHQKEETKRTSLSKDAEDDDGTQKSSKISSEPSSSIMDMDPENDDMRMSESEEEEKVGPVFECLMCLTEFPDRHALGRHYKSVHGKKVGQKFLFQCPKCPKHYAGQDSLKQHWLSAHLDYHRFQCPECQKSFSKSHHLKVHIESVHKRQQQTEKEEDEDEKQNTLPSPLLKGQCVHNKPSFKLNDTQSLRGNLNIHRIIQHEKRFECDKCFKAFPTNYKLKRHYAVHEKELM